MRLSIPFLISFLPQKAHRYGPDPMSSQSPPILIAFQHWHISMSEGRDSFYSMSVKLSIALNIIVNSPALEHKVTR